MDPNVSIWFHLYTVRVKGDLEISLRMLRCRFHCRQQAGTWLHGSAVSAREAPHIHGLDLILNNIPYAAIPSQIKVETKSRPSQIKGETETRPSQIK